MRNISPGRRKLTYKKAPSQSPGGTHKTLNISVGLILETGLLIFCLFLSFSPSLIHLPLSLPFHPTLLFKIHCLLLIRWDHGQTHQFPCQMCNLLIKLCNLLWALWLLSFLLCASINLVCSLPFRGGMLHRCKTMKHWERLKKNMEMSLGSICATWSIISNQSPKENLFKICCVIICKLLSIFVSDCWSLFILGLTQCESKCSTN